MYQDIFGYSKFSSVTTMLVELASAPTSTYSFNTVLYKSASFSHR